MICKIANAAGFWGDNLDAPRRLVEGAEVDYLTLEYLAELTLSILARIREKDPTQGYPHDFLTVLESLLPALTAQPNLRIVTNAGGMNPQACAAAAGQILARAGFARLLVGVVSGDDIVGRLDELGRAGCRLENLETGEPLSALRQPIASANAYLGARPIAEALAGGARLVLTGRVADASLTLGPAVHEFGLAVERLEPSGRRQRGRPFDRMRRPGHWRTLSTLAASRLGKCRLPDRRTGRRRLVCHHQARGHRGPGQSGNRHRAIAVRNWRSGPLFDTRRRRRFHHGRRGPERAGSRAGPRCDGPTGNCAELCCYLLLCNLMLDRLRCCLSTLLFIQSQRIRPFTRFHRARNFCEARRLCDSHFRIAANLFCPFAISFFNRFYSGFFELLPALLHKGQRLQPQPLHHAPAVLFAVQRLLCQQNHISALHNRGKANGSCR